VTVPPGASDGAGGAADDAPAGVASSGFGAGACR